MYRIAGNFWGRKLLRICKKYNFRGENFHRLLAFPVPMDATPQILRRKLSRRATKPRNLSPSKVSRSTVLHVHVMDIQSRQHSYHVWFSKVSSTEGVIKREVSLDYEYYHGNYRNGLNAVVLASNTLLLSCVDCLLAGSGKMVLHYQLDYICPEPFSGNTAWWKSFQSQASNSELVT